PNDLEALSYSLSLLNVHYRKCQNEKEILLGHGEA
ncbi:unnamed protein product, partial [marine sediment metagenome]